MDEQQLDRDASPSMAQFAEMEKADRNAWWRLESGDHENLFNEAREQVARLTEAIDAARDESLAQFELREAAEARVLRLQKPWTAEEMGEVALALADSVPSDDLTVEGWLKRAHAAEEAIRSARRELWPRFLLYPPRRRR